MYPLSQMSVHVMCRYTQEGPVHVLVFLNKYVYDLCKCIQIGLYGVNILKYYNREQVTF